MGRYLTQKSSVHTKLNPEEKDGANRKELDNMHVIDHV
jgi:hypothetical protein